MGVASATYIGTYDSCCVSDHISLLTTTGLTSIRVKPERSEATWRLVCSVPNGGANSTLRTPLLVARLATPSRRSSPPLSLSPFLFFENSHTARTINKKNLPTLKLQMSYDLFMPHNRATSRSTQPCIPPGSLNRVPASARVRAGMSPLPGGR